MEKRSLAVPNMRMRGVLAALVLALGMSLWFYSPLALWGWLASGGIVYVLIGASVPFALLIIRHAIRSPIRR